MKKRECTGLKHLLLLKAFIEYSNDMEYIYDNIEEYSLNKKRKILILYDDMIADILSNEKCNIIVIKLFIRKKKN